jgi:hypothetical protein
MVYLTLQRKYVEKRDESLEDVYNNMIEEELLEDSSLYIEEMGVISNTALNIIENEFGLDIDRNKIHSVEEANKLHIEKNRPSNQVSEKFQEESDPIKDMGIGMRNQLKEFQLNVVDIWDMPVHGTSKTLVSIMFKEPIDNLYYLGYSDLLEVEGPEYLERLNKLIEKGKLISYKKNVLSPPHQPEDADHLKLYDTSIGKIMMMYTYEGPEMIYAFIGDLEAAVNLYILSKKSIIL